MIVGDVFPGPDTQTPGDGTPDAPSESLIIDRTLPPNVEALYNALNISETPKPTEDINRTPEPGDQKEDNLPQGGDKPFKPKKQKGGKIPRDRQGRFIDRQDNKWEWDPIKREWDVQHRNGRHTNIGPDGRITHGPDNFPR